MEEDGESLKYATALDCLPVSVSLGWKIRKTGGQPCLSINSAMCQDTHFYLYLLSFPYLGYKSGSPGFFRQHMEGERQLVIVGMKD